MALAPNGRAPSLHEDMEMRRLSAAQTQQVLAGQGGGFPVQFPGGGAYTVPVFMRTDAPEIPDVQIRPIRGGLIDAFVKTCQRWRLTEGEQNVLLGYGANTALAAEILAGRYLNLPQDVKDRVGYVVGISVGLGALFNEGIRAELDWLNRPHPKLRNQPPLAAMLQGRMAQLIAVSALVDEERALR
jgi:hypothetical protein